MRTSRTLAVVMGLALFAALALVGVALADPLGQPTPPTAAKQSFEVAYQAARSADAAAPRAPKPATPVTPVPGVQNLGALGISEYKGTPVRGAQINTQANVLSLGGGFFTVYAGVTNADPTQGVFIVLDRNHDDGAIQRVFPLAPGSGVPRITVIDGDSIIFVTPRGVGHFEFTTGTIR